MSDNIQRPEMTYKPPPINPPSPVALLIATVSALLAIGAVFALRSGAEAVTAILLIVSQVLCLINEVAIPYTGPPINPPVPPRRLLEVSLEAIAIAGLGLALFDIGRQPSPLFTRAIAVAVAAQGIFLIVGVTAGRSGGRASGG